MYAWIFRHLPGPLWCRILITLVLVAALLVLLVQYFFPWMSQFTSFTDSSVNSDG